MSLSFTVGSFLRKTIWSGKVEWDGASYNSAIPMSKNVTMYGKPEGQGRFSGSKQDWMTLRKKLRRRAVASSVFGASPSFPNVVSSWTTTSHKLRSLLEVGREREGNLTTASAWPASPAQRTTAQRKSPIKFNMTHDTRTHIFAPLLKTTTSRFPLPTDLRDHFVHRLSKQM